MRRVYADWSDADVLEQLRRRRKSLDSDRQLVSEETLDIERTELLELLDEAEQRGLDGG